MSLKKYIMHMSGKISPTARFVIVMILITVVISAVVPERERPVDVPTRKPIPVRVQRVKKGPVRDMIYLPAVVIPERVVQVAAEVSGRVESYAGCNDKPGAHGKVISGPDDGEKIDDGVQILKSAPLIYLNQDILRPDFQQANASYQLAKREYERVKAIEESGAATNTELDRARTTMETARSRMELTKQRLERSIIIAPITGIVDHIYIEEGDYVSPGKAVADIVDMSTVKIVFDIPEREFTYFRDRKGKEVEIHLRDTGKTISGTITYISARADRDSLTTQVQVSVDNAAGKFHSGQILKADLLCRTINTVMVPLKAVIADKKEKDLHLVYVAENGTAVRRYVQIDLSVLRGDQVRIVSGLNGGEQLIVEGQRQLGPGQKITIVTGRTPSTPDKK